MEDELINESIRGLRSEGHRAAQALCDLSGRIGGREGREAFVDYLMNHSHRTLQQSAFSLFLNWAYRFAELPDGHFDLRNEAAVKAARKIKEALGDYGDQLPFI